MMTEQHEACIVLAQRIGELESQNAQLVAELAVAHHQLAARDATLADLRRKQAVSEAAAGYERARVHERY